MKGKKNSFLLFDFLGRLGFFCLPSRGLIFCLPFWGLDIFVCLLGGLIFLLAFMGATFFCLPSWRLNFVHWKTICWLQRMDGSHSFPKFWLNREIGEKRGKVVKKPWRLERDSVPKRSVCKSCGWIGGNLISIPRKSYSKNGWKSDIYFEEILLELPKIIQWE